MPGLLDHARFDHLLEQRAQAACRDLRADPGADLAEGGTGIPLQVLQHHGMQAMVLNALERAPSPSRPCPMHGSRSRGCSASRTCGARLRTIRLDIKIKLRRASQLVEPPTADPRGRRCGGWELDNLGYPIRPIYILHQLSKLYT